MKKTIRLAKLPDRAPVKLTITLGPDLAARLRTYADLYAETYGAREEPAELVPYMLEAFLNGDVEFRRASRAKADDGATTKTPPVSANPAHGRIEREPDIRDPSRRPRIVGPRSDASAG
jgi:hypothetical protein